MYKDIKLNGIWKAWPSKRGPLPRDFYSQPEKTADWFDIRVPGNWQTQGNFGDDENIVYYFTTFRTPPIAEGQNLLLELSRVFNSTEIWINGRSVKKSRDYYVKSKTNITKHLSESENNMFVKVSWPSKKDIAQHEMLGVYGEWEYEKEDMSPGGICGDVILRVVNEIYINDMVISYEFKELNWVEINLRLNINSKKDADIICDWQITPENCQGTEVKGSTPRSIGRGNSYLKLSISVHNPLLWYPWEQGDPNLYRITIDITESDQLRDRKSQTIGFRKIEERNGSIIINDKRQFLRGIIYLPTFIHSEAVNRDVLEKDIQLILDAGINTIRLFHHIPTQELYDICNENGLLLWQDIPFNFSTDSKTQNYILRRTVYLHNSLHHNPSLIIWGKPSKVDTKYLFKEKRRLRGVSKVKKISRTLKKLDNNRLIIENIKYYNIFKMINSKFNYSTQVDKFKIALERITVTKGKLKIISNYGFPSFPEIATMVEVAAEINNKSKTSWIHLPDENNIYYQRIEQQLPLDDFERAPTFYMATQNFQARLLRYYHELCRRYKYKPFGGCFMYFFADNCLIVSDSIVDYYRRTKQGYTATKRSLQPICVLMDWPEESYIDGDIIKLNIYVINDTHNAFPSSVLKWKIINSESEVFCEDRKIVDMFGDDSLTVETLRIEVTPEFVPGNYRVQLELELPTQECLGNSYQLKILE